ncbi:MAG: hypothetical protein JXA60_02020 [Candidatus Coatesbacteria bacterium]|nr:hypothetical protein [Candidatus Coatesbacteria bacterium]
MQKKNLFKLLLIVFLSLILFTCGERDNPFDPDGNNYKGPYDFPILEYPDSSANYRVNMITLSWRLGNPSGWKTTYDVYFGLEGHMKKITENIDSTRFTVNELAEDKKYIWQIVANSQRGTSEKSNIWRFTTNKSQNKSPNPPHDPSPANHAQNIPLDTKLAWECEDPDSLPMFLIPGKVILNSANLFRKNSKALKDSLWYFVYFGKESNPTFADKSDFKYYTPKQRLEYSTKYYWKIVAYDTGGNQTEGPIWDFTTIPDSNKLWIRITEPGNRDTTVDSLLAIRWEFNAPGSSNPVVSLYYDKDGIKNGDEVSIKENIKANDRYFLWNCRGVNEGSYYILAMLDDNLLGKRITRIKVGNQQRIKSAKLKKPDSAYDYSDARVFISHDEYQPPTINVTQPSAANDSALEYYDIRWEFKSDKPESTYVSLYTDKDDIPGGESLIAENIKASDQFYKWTCDTMSTDTLYIKAVIDDGHTLYQKGIINIARQAIHRLKLSIAYPDTSYDYSDGKLKLIPGLLKTIDKPYGSFSVNSVSLSKDYLLAGGNSNIVKRWHLPDFVPVNDYQGHKQSVNSVKIFDDGNRGLSGSGDSKMIYWDFNSGNKTREFDQTSSIRSISLFKDQNFALSAGDAGILKYWDLNTGECLKAKLVDARYVNACEFTLVSNYALTAGSDNDVKLWNLGDNSVLPTATFTGHRGEVRCICLNRASAGNYFATSSNDSTIRYWRTSQTTPIFTIEKAHNASILSISISLDGNYLISGGKDNCVKYWDLTNQELIITFTGHESSVKTVDLTPKRFFAVSGGDDQTIRFWRLPR